tara:strand:+ start:8696 stop:8875 length:180 start_codon:yes stop_codon:yes gene_type:complete
MMVVMMMGLWVLRGWLTDVWVLGEAFFVEFVDAETGSARGDFGEEVGAQRFAGAFTVPA